MQKDIYDVLSNSAYCFFFDGTIEKDIKDKKENHYWHNGLAVTINGPLNHDFQIEARGNVEFILCEKGTDKELFHVKDRRNGGTLYSELSKYIKDDTELNLLISDNHPKYYSIIEHSNWWECLILDENLQYVDFSWVLDGYSLSDAVDEVVKGINDVINTIIPVEEHEKYLERALFA